MAINQDQSDSVGIKLSQLGQDANVAADQDLVFNSSFPYVKIVSRGLVTVQEGVDKVITNHNLGYPPGYILYLVSTDNPFYFVSPGSLLFGSSYVFSDSTSLSYLDLFGNVTGYSYVYYYIIFDFNLEENYTSPVKKTASVNRVNSDNDYGIKVLRGDKRNINSSDMRDFSIHSGGRSPLINKISYFETMTLNGSGSYEVSQSHGLDYVPMSITYLSYKNTYPKADGKWYAEGFGFGGATFNTINTSVITFGATENRFRVSIVSLKDPFTITSGVNEVLTT